MDSKTEAVYIAIRALVKSRQNFLSYSRIAKAAEVNRDTAVNAVRALEIAGEIIVERADNHNAPVLNGVKPKKCNRYKLPIPTRDSDQSESDSVSGSKETLQRESQRESRREGEQPSDSDHPEASPLTTRPAGLPPFEAPPPQGWDPKNVSAKVMHWQGARLLNRALVPYQNSEGVRVRPACTGNVLRAVQIVAAYLMGGTEDTFTDENLYTRLNFIPEMTRAEFLAGCAAMPFDLRGVLIEDGWWLNRDYAEDTFNSYEERDQETPWPLWDSWTLRKGPASDSKGNLITPPTKTTGMTDREYQATLDRYLEAGGLLAPILADDPRTPEEWTASIIAHRRAHKKEAVA